ncbi:MAG TPA: helix-turn-helix transcriptional regulator [Propylenella sp.]
MQSNIAAPTGHLNETLGSRIAYAREAQGLSTAQLARRFGVRTETMLRWETDRARPRANRLQLLAGLLGVSLAWLLAGQGVGPQEPREEADDEDGGDALGAEISRLRDDAVRILQRIDAIERVARLSANPPR